MAGRERLMPKYVEWVVAWIAVVGAILGGLLGFTYLPDPNQINGLDPYVPWVSAASMALGVAGVVFILNASLRHRVIGALGKIPFGLRLPVYRKVPTTSSLASRAEPELETEQSQGSISANPASPGQPELHRAIDTLVTWLFREEHKYERQPNEAWTRTPAPADYGQELYELLGLSDTYAPTKSFAVAPKPGFEKPDIVPDWADENLRGDEGLPDPWLPNPSDLSTFGLSDDGLDLARDQALDAAHDHLAPDARIEFLDVELTPEALVRFLGWSETADQARVFVIGSSGLFGVLGRDRAWASARQTSGQAIAEWADPEPMPWHTDGSWLALVRAVGYRTRPFQGYASLALRQPHRQPDEPAVWTVEAQRTSEGVTDLYWLENDRLQSEPWTMG